MGSAIPSLIGVAYSELPLRRRDLAEMRSEMLGLLGGPSLELLGLLELLLPLLGLKCWVKP